jgi:serine phosphatase RsbU (regulator of sigma subunit)/putative methionine-R-sulfoxide reductase with GAF domain
MTIEIVPKLPDNWQIFVQLGKKILDLPHFGDQELLVKRTLEETLHCEANIWLAEELLQPQSQQSGILQNQSKLIQSVINEKKPAFKIGTRKAGRIIRNWDQVYHFTSPPLVVAFPISVRDTLLGVMELTRPDGSGFLTDELDFLNGLSHQIAIAIQASRQNGGDQRQFEMLSLVRTVSAQIANVLDLDVLARQITKLIRDTFRYYFVAIFTVKPGQLILEYRDSAPQFQTWIPQLTVRLGDGIIGYAALTGEEVIANDVKMDRRHQELNVLHETRSEVAIPLKYEDRVMGVLDVQSDQLNAFQELDLLVLRSLADHIATAIENTRLYGDIQKRAGQLISISEVSSAITSILDEDALLSEVVRLLTNRMSYPEVHVYDVHPGRRKIFFRAGESASGPISSQPDLDLDDPGNLITWVATNAQSKLINDFSTESFSAPESITFGKAGSAILIPMIFGEDVLGILYILGERPGMFGEDDAFLLGALADNIAIAMRNAYLYRSEQWRRRVAEGMREIAGVLTANADVGQILHMILKELEGTLPIDISAIWLLEPGTDKSESNPGEPKNAPLRLSAVRTSEAFMSSQNFENTFTPEEIISSCNESSLPSPFLQQALFNQNPLTRTKDAPYEPLGAILDFPEDYSAIAAPLMIGNEPMGLLTLAHHTSGRYGHEAKNMAATFASYAAVAIENTQLYEAANDQAWVSTVLLQVAEATQSLNSLDELLTTMVQMTPNIIGIASCSIFLWDNLTETFTPVATYGMPSDKESLFEELWVALGEIEPFDHLFFKKSPIIISENTIGEKRTYVSTLFENFISSTHSAVLFPMITHGDILGAFLVSYNLETNDSRPNGLGEQIDWNQRFTLIQGIAHQTAVAVENIQLLKAQREEAYVSVALLQVAQAVVSLNALEEIIESIVRLAPILIGVKRCAVLLWDPESDYYRLVDSFGISRSELDEAGRRFLENEFPLLDCVRKSNQMVYYISDDESEKPINWPLINGDRFQTIVPSQKEFLRSQGSLLMGFPLSVKGTVLGVMLTQEMEFTNSATLFQAREKRLEIAIGITQQTSLAIQNSQLQKEVVERERLEREFQLAREIQQTFLPEKMPEISGWEVAGSWHPARQVSGDFYDLILLPGDMLGLVIADVADKGMPAALFMTLIRTLIRASARESNSPAQVLKRVNELLIPDAKHGMFVTVVYAMVNLKTGQVIYASAGHNPPIIRRGSNQRFDILPRTGMALGVLEDMPLADQSKKLAPGDCLIFYTDGITESFSPQGEMFGEARLFEAINDPDVSNVANLITTIENAVDTFIEGQDYSDDLTLLALHRKKAA